MNIRRRTLPGGWYPDSAEEIEDIVTQWMKTDRSENRRDAVSGVVPHAGWFFSGRIALCTLLRLDPGFDTLVLVGGHLPAHAGILCPDADGFETPSGTLTVDGELLREIRKTVPCLPDRFSDNSVEVLLPMVRFLFPGKTIAVFRAPPSASAENLAETIRSAALKTGRSVRVIGSTDLTHYGPSYNFTSQGFGSAAEEWVTKTNDAGFVKLMLGLDTGSALSHALKNKSACSAGAAVVSAAYARLCGVQKGELVEYTTSLERHQSDSFVGYAGIVYRLESR